MIIQKEQESPLPPLLTLTSQLERGNLKWHGISLIRNRWVDESIPEPISTARIVCGDGSAPNIIPLKLNEAARENVLLGMLISIESRLPASRFQSEQVHDEECTSRATTRNATRMNHIYTEATKTTLFHNSLSKPQRPVQDTLVSPWAVRSKSHWTLAGSLLYRYFTCWRAGFSLMF